MLVTIALANRDRTIAMYRSHMHLLRHSGENEWCGHTESIVLRVEPPGIDHALNVLLHSRQDLADVGARQLLGTFLEAFHEGCLRLVPRRCSLIHLLVDFGPMRGGKVFDLMSTLSFAFKPLPLWLPFRSPSSTIVNVRRLPQHFTKAFFNASYIDAAAAPFHVPETTCHMMTLSFATAAAIVTDGTPKNECLVRTFVKPRLVPSEGLRRCPFTRACLIVDLCLAFRGNGNDLQSM